MTVLGPGPGPEDEKLENFCGFGSEKLEPSATLVLYLKKIKAEVVLFVKSALFVSKSDSHERRSTNIFKISMSVTRT